MRSTTRVSDIITLKLSQYVLIIILVVKLIQTVKLQDVAVSDR